MLDDPYRTSLDALIEESVIFGELSAGTDAAWLSSHADARLVAVLAAGAESDVNRPAGWSEEEDRFVIENVHRLTDQEIGDVLGRTALAVRIHTKRRLTAYTRSHHPEYLTAQEVKRRMGIPCAKAVTNWIKAGLLSAIVLPLECHIWGIHIYDLTRFVVNPENWIYFKPERIVDLHLRRLVELRRQRWPDEWWTPGQAAAYHGVGDGPINNRIHDGVLPAKRWGNWWIKRSDVVVLRIFPRMGHHQEIVWTSAGDAFLVLARALGFSYAAIGKMGGWTDERTEFRLGTLKKKDAIDGLIQQHKLAVCYDRASGHLFADWRDYRSRFPRLVAAQHRFLAGQAKAADLNYIAYTLHTWAQWHARTEEERYEAYCLRYASNHIRSTLQRYYVQLQGQGLEPLR